MVQFIYNNLLKTRLQPTTAQNAYKVYCVCGARKLQIWFTPAPFCFCFCVRFVCCVCFCCSLFECAALVAVGYYTKNVKLCSMWLPLQCNSDMKLWMFCMKEPPCAYGAVCRFSFHTAKQGCISHYTPYGRSIQYTATVLLYSSRTARQPHSQLYRLCSCWQLNEKNFIGSEVNVVGV